MHILLPVPLPLLVPYVAASQLLRPVLGPKAPSAATLVETGLTNRQAGSIAEEFLEFNGYPTLATCRRKLRLRRKAARQGGRPSRFPQRSRPLAAAPLGRGGPADPSRN